jgi:acid phosphatase
MNPAGPRTFIKPVILLLVLAALTSVTSLRGETNTKPFAQTPVWASSKLYAILWMQNSAEYQAVARQAYAAAAYQIDKALADTSATALDETTGNSALKKPAVILDVDETVLRNTPYGAWTIRNQKSWDQQDWWEWCRLGVAEAVPGVVDYIQTAMTKGVHIIYLTNRSDKVAAATRNNLASEGLIPDPEKVTFYFKEDEERLGGKYHETNKIFRRKQVEKEYRVIQMFGDSLGDFTGNGHLSLMDRRALVNHNQSRWGRSWFMLPNPEYGSWKESLKDYQHLNQAETFNKEMRALQPMK